jgi:hypothetical protein
MFGKIPTAFVNRVSQIPRPRLGHLVIFIGLFCLLAIPPAFGQAAVDGSSQTGQGGRIPLSHLYQHFLLHQNHLDKTAATREQQGKDGQWLRNYYQQRLGFKDSEFAMVRKAATQLESDLKQIDTEVQTIIQADRARHPRVLLSPNDLPPVPPRLLELRDQRAAVIQRYVDSLTSVLGRELAAKLDAFLEDEFAPNVSIRYVSPPRPHDPDKHPVPPFATEVEK